MEDVSIKKILIVAAHPDDETIGAGASINKWVRQGCEVYCLFMTDGESSRIGFTDSDAQYRNKSLLRASNVLGFKLYGTNNFPDNKLDSVPLLEVIKTIEAAIKDINPSIVVTHDITDLNIDHKLVNNAVMVATRPDPECSVKTVMSFEVLSATGWDFSLSNQFNPNYFNVITIEDWQKKEQSLLCYSKEVRKAPHCRSIDVLKSLAVLRGSYVGRPLVEAFNILRNISDEI